MGGRIVETITRSAEETMALGQRFASALPENAVVCFFGDLGAGKTTFIKGMALAVTGDDGDTVSSPTFSYLNIYPGKEGDSQKRTLYHFDLYRIGDAEEFFAMGFDDFFGLGGVCCIEWSERIASLLPKRSLRVTMEHCGEGMRRITIQ
jgi:tRNA threonylcarbamoyladenosine biosynthesis protein TsaE